MAFRNYVAGTIFTVLLIWGPIDHSWPAWLAIRTAYLILVPLTIWLIIGWAWTHWEPSKTLEIALERILSGLVCITLFVMAVLEATSKTHIGNNQSIQTRDGIEDVGEDIVLRGPSWPNVFILVFIAILLLWFGFLKGGAKN